MALFNPGGQLEVVGMKPEGVLRTVRGRDRCQCRGTCADVEVVQRADDPQDSEEAECASQRSVEVRR